jgi:hypothetical protein
MSSAAPGSVFGGNGRTQLGSVAGNGARVVGLVQPDGGSSPTGARHVARTLARLQVVTAKGTSADSRTLTERPLVEDVAAGTNAEGLRTPEISAGHVFSLATEGGMCEWNLVG